jgi:hypothetical protein
MARPVVSQRRFTIGHIADPKRMCHSVVGTARCAVRGRVQKRRNELPGPFILPCSARPPHRRVGRHVRLHEANLVWRVGPVKCIDCGQ